MTLPEKTARGVFWSGISQWGRLGLTLLTTIVLVRLLPPESFGLLAMCTVFTGFFASVGDLGLGSALVQAEAPSADDLNSAFWVSAGIGVCACLLFVAIAPLIAAFYRVGELAPVLRWLSTGLAASSLGVVHQAVLTRAMDFRKIAIVELTGSALGGTLGIAAAVSGAGVYSLVIQSVAGAVCVMTGYWVAASWRPDARFAGFRRGGLVRYGTHLVGFNAVNYVARNADYLLVGKFLGAEQLGYYSLAYRLMMFPLQNISSVLGRVLLPAFSAIQRDDARMRDAFMRLSRYVALVTFPLMLGVLVTARELVVVVFGVQWQPAVPVVQILACVGLLQSIGTNTGTLFMAKGRTDLLFRWGLCATAVIVTGIALGLARGIVGVAIGYAIAYLLLFGPGIAIPLRLVGGRLNEVLGGLLPVLAVSGAAAACVFGWRLVGIDMLALPRVLQLAVSGTLMAGVYVALVSKFMRGTLAEVRGMFMSTMTASR